MTVRTAAITRRLALAMTCAALASAAVPTAGLASSYCTPTGDFCQFAGLSNGRITLEMRTFSLRGRVTTCVRSPLRRTVCRSFALRLVRGLYTARAYWSAHYPRQGAGIYTVTWSQGGQRFGRPLTFRLS